LYILIAETDLLFLAEMKLALEQSGYDVLSCSESMAAWDYVVGSEAPDLLVTRCRLGLGAPPGTALGLQAQSHHPRIPVIYIPSSVEMGEYADPKHGAVLIKPFAAADLIATVDQLLGKSALSPHAGTDWGW
jgi:DNA-binding response OmpR family regulator